MLHALAFLVVFASVGEAPRAPIEAPPLSPPFHTVQNTPAQSPAGRPSGSKAQAVPEPAALLLVGSGLVGLALTRRRRRSAG